MSFKPYQLVVVSEPVGDRITGIHRTVHRYVGQVMSFETPDLTYVVRRVPNFAGTIVEMPVQWLSRCLWNPVLACVHLAIVRGSGAFPIGLMRSQRCVPVNFDINENCRAVLREGLGENLVIARCAENKAFNAFDTERWEWCGWRIERLGTELVTSL